MYIQYPIAIIYTKIPISIFIFIETCDHKYFSKQKMGFYQKT